MAMFCLRVTAALTRRTAAGTTTITLFTSGESRRMKQVSRNLSSHSSSMEMLTKRMTMVWRVLTVLNTRLSLVSERFGAIREQVKNEPVTIPWVIVLFSMSIDCIFT